MDTWEIILNALIRILREHLPAELTRRNIPPIAETHIAADEEQLTTADCVFLSFVGDKPTYQDSQWVDALIEIECEITRFGPDRTTARNTCARTKAAVVRVLRQHMGLDDQAQTDLAMGFKQLRIGESEPMSGKDNTGRFAHALAFPLIADVRSGWRTDGSPPDL